MCTDSKAPWVTVVVGLGSNLGDRASTLQKAVERLTRGGHFHLEKLSSFYETEPVGPPQPTFLNGAAKGTTDLSAEAFLDLLKESERMLGRTPGPRWGAREIDLDLLFYGESVIESATLMVPHPRLQEREFVLEPLAEIVPTWRHPRLGKTVLELLESLYFHETPQASHAGKRMEPVTPASGKKHWVRPDDGGAS